MDEKTWLAGAPSSAWMTAKASSLQKGGIWSCSFSSSRKNSGGATSGLQRGCVGVWWCGPGWYRYGRQSGRPFRLWPTTAGQQQGDARCSPESAAGSCHAPAADRLADLDKGGAQLGQQVAQLVGTSIGELLRAGATVCQAALRQPAAQRSHNLHASLGHRHGSLQGQGD